jgi:hypothetical protein
MAGPALLLLSVVLGTSVSFRSLLRCVDLVAWRFELADHISAALRATPLRLLRPTLVLWRRLARPSRPAQTAFAFGSDSGIPVFDIDRRIVSSASPHASKPRASPLLIPA